MRKSPKPVRDSGIGRANQITSILRLKFDSFNLEQFDVIVRNKHKVATTMSASTKGFCSFYITNFPAEWSLKDLMKIFSRYDQVKDVMIPEKRNKMGWRYEFAHFYGSHIET